MKFTFIFATLLTIIYTVSASDQFELWAYSDANAEANLSAPFCYDMVYARHNILYYGANERPLVGQVTPCGYLQFAEGDYAVVTRDGYLQRGPGENASNGFSLRNGHLYYRNVDGFEAIFYKERFLITTLTHQGGMNFYVKALKFNSTDQAGDFRPTGACVSRNPS